MNDQMIRKVTLEIVERDIPENTDLWGRIQKHMILPSPHNDSSAVIPRFKIAAAISIIVLIIILFSTSFGRALAQKILGFFTSTTSDSFPLTEPEIQRFNEVNKATTMEFQLPLMEVESTPPIRFDPSTPGCDNALAYETYTCKIKRAELKLGFDIEELPYMLSGWSLRKIDIYPNLQQAILTFQAPGGMFIFSQGIGEIPDSYFKWENVPENYIESVDFGGLSGEYVRGGFWVKNGQEKAEWDPDSLPERLVWRDGQRWFRFEEWITPGSSGYLYKAKLIDLASNLVDSLAVEEKPPLDYIHYTEVVEALAGFKLKTPSKLPLGVQFTHAEFNHQDLHASLFFDGKARIILREKPSGMSSITEMKNNASQYVEVQVGSYPGYLTTQPEGDTIPTVAGQTPLFFLTWSDERLIYEMIYYKYDSFGGVISKDEVIAIAKSMRAGYLSANQTTPYAWVQGYEKLLGFSFQEIRTDPKSIQFIGVEGYPTDDYLVLVYKDETNGTMLFLYQGIGQPIKDIEWENIPKTSRKIVNIGASGELAWGNWVGDEWKEDAPYARIRWKENEKWLEIIAVAEPGQSLDREWLIRLAQSTR